VSTYSFCFSPRGIHERLGGSVQSRMRGAECSHGGAGLHLLDRLGWGVISDRKCSNGGVSGRLCSGVDFRDNATGLVGGLGNGFCWGSASPRLAPARPCLKVERRPAERNRRDASRCLRRGSPVTDLKTPVRNHLRTRIRSLLVWGGLGRRRS
jgi:hypothetical protein